MKYYLESLGCPKNLVDSQGMARLLDHLGHAAVDDPRRAELLIVNTCGFVEDARAESLAALERLARRKRPNQMLIAAGCLSQRWGGALASRVAGVDALLGTRRWHEIGSLVEELAARRRQHPPDPLARLDDSTSAAAEGQGYARQGSSAYLKVADGCSAPCAFCAIPLIKGPARSRPLEEIVRDAVGLVDQGIQEIILIAQDTTAYGRDRGEKDALPDLVQAILHAAPGLRWLRLMYAYPGHVSARLIDRMAGDPRVCHYLDLPLQHAHPAVLRRMRRPANMDLTRRLIADLRTAMPDVALRTSLIVGYPGETEAEFGKLLEFLREVRFDRVGAFIYSPEEGTAALSLPDPVPAELKADRHDRLLAAQQPIALERNQAQVGRTLEVLIEGKGDGLLVGRCYRDAPEIDGLVLLPVGPHSARVGSMIRANVTAAMEYDLVAEQTWDRPEGVIPREQSDPGISDTTGKTRKRDASHR